MSAPAIQRKQLPLLLIEDEPGVMSFVREALERLQGHRLAGPARGADSRVSKYEHRLQEVFNLSRAETAVLWPRSPLRSFWGPARMRPR